jgi:hypothetical protein
MTLRQSFFGFCVLALLIQRAHAAEGPAPAPKERGGKESSGQDDLFDSRRILKIALDIGPSALAALQTNADNHAYVRCTLREGGQSLTEVGIHCQGDTAKQLVNGRPDFTITFDKFVRGQTFHGQRRLILNSSREDPSYLSAPIAFELFRQAGVPAPRTGFARVQLNGRDLGLYGIDEGVNQDFLRRHFGNTDGNLYDEGDTHDVTGKLDKDRGEGKDQADVDALVAAARVTDPSERWQQLRQRLDVDRFLIFIGLEVLLWNEDSYALGARKFRLYHDSTTDRLVFFPKGIERVLEKTDGPAMPKCKGMVADAVLTTAQGEVQYRKTLAKLLDTVFVSDKVQARARELAANLREAAAGSGAAAAREFDAAVARFCDAVGHRARWVAEELNRADATPSK